MTVEIVILGALGRMGTAIRTLAENDPELKISGLIECADYITEKNMAGTTYPLSSDLAEVLKEKKGAVVIDFTTPQASIRNADIAAQAGNPVVCGTTGFSAEQMAALEEIAGKTPYLLAPNMSVGINLLLKMLPEFIRALGPAYDLELVEIHHNKKKDAPSGTALKLAECMASARNTDLNKTARYCRHGLIGERPAGEIGLQTVRGGDVVGVHTIYMLGTGERLEITHQAHSRDTFAMGALRAAKWLAGRKPGRIYSMQDVLNN